MSVATPSPDRQGRPPDAARRLVGLDLGGTNIKRVVVEAAPDGTLEVLDADSSPTPRGGPEEVCARLVALGREAAAHGDAAPIGVGLPGLVTADGVAELIPNVPGHWPGFPVAATLAAGFGRAPRLINDARACTLAEASVGAAAGCRTVVCMVLGTGVGGGIVVDGRLHEGRWGIAGEIGHQTVAPDGPRCGCGNAGCVEAMAKASAIARLGGRATAAEVFAGAAEGDARCREAVEVVVGYLGIALGNLVTVLGPDRIVIGGGIAAAGEALLHPLRRAVAARSPLVDGGEIDLVAAALGPTAGAIGAAVATLQRPGPTA